MTGLSRISANLSHLNLRGTTALQSLAAFHASGSKKQLSSCYRAVEPLPSITAALKILL
jgi:hypothetical protein